MKKVAKEKCMWRRGRMYVWWDVADMRENLVRSQNLRWGAKMREDLWKPNERNEMHPFLWPSFSLSLLSFSRLSCLSVSFSNPIDLDVPFTSFRFTEWVMMTDRPMIAKLRPPRLQEDQFTFISLQLFLFPFTFDRKSSDSMITFLSFTNRLFALFNIHHLIFIIHSRLVPDVTESLTSVSLSWLSSYWLPLSTRIQHGLGPGMKQREREREKERKKERGPHPERSDDFSES